MLELGQSVDFALRSLTHSQETLVQGIMEQNRALTNTCDGMISQLKELTLTNKALVDEMKDMRVRIILLAFGYFCIFSSWHIRKIRFNKNTNFLFLA